MSKIPPLIFIFSMFIIIHKSYSKPNTNETEIKFNKDFVEEAYFIDKTDLILQFLKHPTNTYDYISCPSGFGKTTNLLMMKAYLQYEMDNLGRPKQRMSSTAYNIFRNTIIDKELGKVKDDIAQHPVIFVNLRIELPEKIDESSSNATDAEFVTLLNEFVYGIISEYEWLKKLMEPAANTAKVKHSFAEWEVNFMTKVFNKQLTEEEIPTSLLMMIKILHDFFEKRVIVLVDDFDYVSRTAILRPSPKSEAFQQIVNKMLREALHTGKDMVSYAMMVGISRLPLTGPNIVENVTFNEHVFLSDHQYSEYFGYLVSDLRHLCTKHKCDKSELQQIQDLYEGYETKIEHRKILNPYSLNAYFKDRGYNEKIRPLKAHWIWGRGEQDFVAKFLNVSPQFTTILAKLTAYNSFQYRLIEDYSKSSYSEFTQLLQRNYEFTAESDPITHLIPFCFENGLFSYTLYEDEYVLPNEEIHQQISKTLSLYYTKLGIDFEALAAALRNLLDGFNTDVAEVKKSFDLALKVFANIPSQAPTEFILQSIIRQTIIASGDLTLTEEKKISRKGRCEIIYSSRRDRSVVHIAITKGKTSKQALKEAPGFGRKKHSTKSVYVGINLDLQKEVEILTQVKTPK